MNSIKRKHAVQVRNALTDLLTDAGVIDMARKVFDNEPALLGIAHQYLYYVSPWLVVNERNLAQESLVLALQRYVEQNKKRDAHALAFRVFIETLAESAAGLANVRVSVKDSDEMWMIWSYDQPLMDWMASYKQYCIQIRQRDEVVSTIPLVIKMLAMISTTRELDYAQLNLSTFLPA